MSPQWSTFGSSFSFLSGLTMLLPFLKRPHMNTTKHSSEHNISISFFFTFIPFHLTIEFITFPVFNACWYLYSFLPECNSLFAIQKIWAACLPLILFAGILYFTLCISEQLFPSASMNQCFLGSRSADCTQLNTSNLCFNYNDPVASCLTQLLQSAPPIPPAWIGF